MLLLQMTAIFLLALPSAAAQSTEAKLKAAYLFNFAKFVDWPDGAFRTGDTPLKLCVLGDHPVNEPLKKVQGQSVRGHSLQYDRLSSDGREASSKQCHIIFMGAGSERGLFDRPLPGVLTVSEDSGPGIIDFRLDEDKVRFAVDLKRAREAGLQISARLLEIALNVKK